MPPSKDYQVYITRSIPITTRTHIRLKSIGKTKEIKENKINVRMYQVRERQIFAPNFLFYEKVEHFLNSIQIYSNAGGHSVCCVYLVLLEILL